MLQRVFDGARKGAGWSVEMWRESHVFRWRVVLGVILAGLVWYLLKGTPPWDTELQERIAERDAEMKDWRAKDYGLFFSWWAAVVNAVILIGLIVTAGWWGKEGGVTKMVRVGGEGEGGVLSRRVFLIVLGAILAVGIYERAPRLNHSFWHDEEYGFRKYTWGFYRDAKGGGVEFKEMGWEETLFRNRLNNHILHSVSARVAHGAWESTLRKEGDPEFREWVIRAVPFACGIGSILVAGLFLGMLGHRVAGLGAAFYLALNPWHMRFSVEARGYIYAMLFIALALMFAAMALRDGRWRNWLLFGLCEVGVFLSNFGCLFVLVILNVGLLGFVALGNSATVLEGARGVLIRRWFVASCLAAAVVIQVALPSVPQVREALENGLGLDASMGLGWWREAWTLLAAGVDWAVSDRSLHHATGAEVEMGKSILFSIWTFGIFPALCLVGFVRAAAKYRLIFLAGIATVGAAFITWGMNEAKDFFLHSWYINYALVGMAVFFGMGFGWLVSVVAKIGWASRPVGALLGLAAVVLVMGIYAVGTAAGRVSIREHDRQAARQVIEMIRGESPAPIAGKEAPMVVGFGMMTPMLVSYQPEYLQAESREEMEALVAQAKAEERELYAIYCGRAVALRNPQIGAIVELCEDEEGDFEEFALVKGMEEIYSFRVFRVGGE